MWRRPPAQLRDAISIAVVGAVVGLAPVLWFSWVWPDASTDGSEVDGWTFGFAIAPFVLIAVLRATTVLRRPGAIVATLVAGGFIVFGQEAAMDPSETSSTASLALVVMPFYSGIAAVVVITVERFLMVLADSRRASRAHRPFV